MGLFSDCLFGCDIDGTLLANGVINPHNIEKIEYFISEGGHFSLSTGRTVGAVSPVLERIKNISPSVVANGCMIYDFQNKKVLDELFIAKADFRVAKAVLDTGLPVGIEAHSGEEIFTINETEETRLHQKYERLKSRNVSFEEAAEYRWNKVVYLFDDLDVLERVKKLISTLGAGSAFSDTSAAIAGKKRNYYEQFPAGVSKAGGLLKLAKILNIKKGGIFAMGDYYNDLEMIKCADISAVPKDTPDDIKAFADYRACSCEDGAVADFIDYLTEIKSDRV